jgi:hypothetical protein
LFHRHNAACCDVAPSCCEPSCGCGL